MHLEIDIPREMLRAIKDGCVSFSRRSDRLMIAIYDPTQYDVVGRKDAVQQARAGETGESQADKAGQV